MEFQVSCWSSWVLELDESTTTLISKISNNVHSHHAGVKSVIRVEYKLKVPLLAFIGPDHPRKSEIHAHTHQFQLSSLLLRANDHCAVTLNLTSSSFLPSKVAKQGLGTIVSQGCSGGSLWKLHWHSTNKNDPREWNRQSRRRYIAPFILPMILRSGRVHIHCHEHIFLTGNTL
jgi:hypothetical protein